MHRAWKIADERSETADWQRARAEEANNRMQRLLYVSEMKVAADALRREDIPSAAELLNHHQPKTGEENLPGFEWYYMNRLIELPSHASISCPDGIFCVQPSPDGSLLAAACGDGNIYIFDAQTGQEVRTIPTGAESANYVCWTSDQTEVATADSSGRIQTWNVSDGMQVRSIDAHDGEVYCLHYLPDDTAIVSSGDDEMIYLWDRATGNKLRTFAGHERDPEQLAVSPDGRYVVSASSDRTLRLWDLQNQQEEPVIWNLNDSRVMCVAYSQDGRHIAACTVHGGVFWSIQKPWTSVSWAANPMEWSR